MKSNYMIFVEQNINGNDVVLLKELYVNITKEKLKEIIDYIDKKILSGFQNPDNEILRFVSECTNKVYITNPKFGPISISYIEIKE